MWGLWNQIVTSKKYSQVASYLWFFLEYFILDAFHLGKICINLSTFHRNDLIQQNLFYVNL